MKVKNIALQIFLCCILMLPVIASPAKAQAENNLMELFKQQARKFEQHYKEQNVSALAQDWTEQGSFITPDGSVYKGRKEIEKFFQSNLAGDKDMALKINVLSVSSPTPSIAIEEGTTSINKNKKPITRYTAVHVKSKDGWKTAWLEESFMNTPRSLDEFYWLCGTWQAKDKAGNPISLRVKKIQNGSFLQGTTGDKGGRQIIGYDPSIDRLISWHFHSGGGFGKGEWQQLDNNHWQQSAFAILPDGRSSMANYSLRKLSNDSFIFHSSGRFIGGIELPETQAIKFDRVTN